jgi:hypothetical protein
MLCLNISGAIIRAYTRACFGPIKSAKERKETKPLPYVDALYARAACWFNRRFPFSQKASLATTSAPVPRWIMLAKAGSKSRSLPAFSACSCSPSVFAASLRSSN